MKGIMSIIEVMITGVILLVAFLHFFPQYSIKSKWDMILLDVKVIDTINTIDRLGKTYELASSSDGFENFMERLFTPEAMIYWKEVNGLEGYTEDTSVPYFTQGQKESIVDVDLSSAEHSVDPNTVGLWHFNVSGSPTLDETDNNNDGDVVGSTWTPSGKFGGAFVFDGDEDYIVAPTTGMNSHKGTVMAWVKVAGPGDLPGYSELIFSHRYGATNTRIYMLKADGTGMSYLVRMGGNSWDDTGCDFVLDEWAHVALVWDNGNYYAYFNGLEVKSGSYTDFGNLDSVVHLGNYKATDKKYAFNGTIDEVVIYDEALTEDEIKDIFNNYDVYSFTLGLGYPY